MPILEKQKLEGLPKIGDPIPGTDLRYEAEDIANLEAGKRTGVSRASTEDVLDEPLLISTTQGADLVTEADEKMADLVPPPEEALKIEPPEEEVEVIEEEEPEVRVATGEGATAAGVKGEWATNPVTGIVEFFKEGTPVTFETPEDIAAKNDLQEAENDKNDLVNQIDQFTITDADLRSQVETIKATWNARIKEMENINVRRKRSMQTLGIRLGTRFTGGLGGAFGGIISEEERQGVMRIVGLEATKQSLINDAKTAAREHNWEVYKLKVDLATKAVDDKKEEIANLQEAQIEQNKKLTEESNRITNQQNVKLAFDSGIDNAADIQSYLSENGIEMDLDEIDKILKIVNPPETYAGLSTDYRTYKHMQETGEVPEGMTYDEYLAAIANAKRKPTEAVDDLIPSDKPLSMNAIDQFRRSYGWVPPLGFSMNQLIQYMTDNPDATPEELEVGAKKVIGEGVSPVAEKERFLTEEYFRESFTDDELKAMSKKAGTARWWTGEQKDIKRFVTEAMGKIEEAREAGFSDTEILKQLTI